MTVALAILTGLFVGWLCGEYLPLRSDKTTIEAGGWLERHLEFINKRINDLYQHKTTLYFQVADLKRRMDRIDQNTP